MVDLDKSGHGFQRVRTYLGPTLGWKDEQVKPSTDITVGGLYQVQPGDSVLLVDVPAAVTIALPNLLRWVPQRNDQPATGFEKSITIKDLGGNAANFNIVIFPFGQQAIDNIQQSVLISDAYGTLKLLPLIDMSGWMVETTGGSGGPPGPGGDVFKAGNNTFTGVNTFTSTVTAPTVTVGDNTTHVATTEFVMGQGFLLSASLTGYAPLFSPTFTGDPKAPTPLISDNDTSIATTAFVQNLTATNFQPLDADLTALAALGGTNVIYYRSAANVWSPVTIGGGLTFTGGTLASSAGGGNVSSSGAPVNLQLAQWINSTQIQGIDISSLGFASTTSPTFTGDPKAPTPATADNDTSIATTAYVKANLATYQPLDADLTAISALAGTNTIYYRSAPDIWSPVTFSGISFSGGVLTVTAGGGNVNNSGTPVAGQIAQWTSAFVIQGVNPSTLGITPSPPQGRLTLATGTPVMTGTTSSATIYYTPYVGQFVPLYNGTSFTMTDMAGELSQLLNDATKSPAASSANSNYDLFVWLDGATMRCTRGPAWTGNTTRGSGAGTTQISMVNGIYLNTVAITNGPAAQRGTYVGTIRTSTAVTCNYTLGAASSGGTAALLNIWNAYNRRCITTTVQDTAASWTYALAAYRSANSSTGNRISAVCGLAEDYVRIHVNSYATASATSVGLCGIGLNVANADNSQSNSSAQYVSSSNPSNAYGSYQLLGFNFYQATEATAPAGTVTFFGSTTSQTITATVWM